MVPNSEPQPLPSSSIMKMADTEKQKESQGKVATSFKDTTRLTAEVQCTRIHRRRILHLIGVLLLLFVLGNLLRDFVVSKNPLCSWFSSLFGIPCFPFPGRHLTTKEREELFL